MTDKTTSKEQLSKNEKSKMNYSRRDRFHPFIAKTREEETKEPDFSELQKHFDAIQQSLQS